MNWLQEVGIQSETKVFGLRTDGIGKRKSLLKKTELPLQEMDAGSQEVLFHSQLLSS
jgi:hypothetical protein